MTLFYLFEGNRIPITAMYDIDGDETENPDDACSMVAQLPNGEWMAARCEPHDIVEVKNEHQSNRAR